MTSGYWGGDQFGQDPFEEFLAQFFGSQQGQQGRRIDLARLMSQDARELIQSAAQKAAGWGSRDLDTEHLLWAICQREPLRQLLARAGAEPGTFATEIEQRVRRGEPRQ
jgi:ATP-dependent Clp protease ATP-binding subunit ClpC